MNGRVKALRAGGVMVRGHRDDIDGLRAVAILPVLLYHANVWPFSGGYVGVDVFFVISGYLITGLILRAQDGFSLADFYDRRIRRILPALGIVLLASTVAALFVLLPDELESFGGSLLGRGAVLREHPRLAARRRLFRAGFGAEPAAACLVAVGGGAVLPVLAADPDRPRPLPPRAALGDRRAGAASLAMALVYARANPNVAFYLLPARAWQLLFGAFMASGALAPVRGAVPRNTLALAGLGLVLAAMLIAEGPSLYHPLNAILAAVRHGGRCSTPWKAAPMG